jgi:Fe-S oxidoreductase
MGVPAIKKLAAKVLGITDRRPFPTFVRYRNPVILSTGKNLQMPTRDHRQRIIFLPDAFARYIEPDTEQAALEILSCCGFDVQIVPVIGAGASLYSKGFIEAAQRHAVKVLDALNKIDPACEAAVVGIEPPEIYFLKDEYSDLLPGRGSEINRRVQNTWLLDEFLVRSDAFNELRIVNLEEKGGDRADRKKKIKFHPHCHQRAEGLSEDGLPTGTSATLELLRYCGYDVELLDTGCCGMAGTFGYEAEHYELSMKVGELKLFPLLRTPSQPPQNPVSKSNLLTENPNADLGEVPFRAEGVLSSGAACRMQIRQGTGREAIHPVLLVANFLKEITNGEK